MKTYIVRERGMGVGAVVAAIALIIVIGVILVLVQTSGEDESRLGMLNDDASNNDVGSGGQGDENTVPPAPQNSVLLGEIETGNFALVERAVLTRPGYVVIYRVNSNSETAMIGRSRLLAVGTHVDVNIQLDNAVAFNQTVIAVLHMDDGDSAFEFPGSDTYMLSAQGGVVSDVEIVDVPRDEEVEVLADQVEEFLENTATTTP